MNCDRIYSRIFLQFLCVWLFRNTASPIMSKSCCMVLCT